MQKISVGSGREDLDEETLTIAPRGRRRIIVAGRGMVDVGRRSPCERFQDREREHVAQPERGRGLVGIAAQRVNPAIGHQLVLRLDDQPAEPEDPEAEPAVAARARGELSKEPTHLLAARRRHAGDGVAARTEYPHDLLEERSPHVHVSVLLDHHGHGSSRLARGDGAPKPIEHRPQRGVPLRQLHVREPYPVGDPPRVASGHGRLERLPRRGLGREPRHHEEIPVVAALQVIEQGDRDFVERSGHRQIGGGYARSVHQLQYPARKPAVPRSRVQQGDDRQMASGILDDQDFTSAMRTRGAPAGGEPVMTHEGRPLAAGIGDVTPHCSELVELAQRRHGPDLHRDVLVSPVMGDSG